jgi:hypothetical protein
MARKMYLNMRKLLQELDMYKQIINKISMKHMKNFINVINKKIKLVKVFYNKFYI